MKAAQIAFHGTVATLLCCALGGTSLRAQSFGPAPFLHQERLSLRLTALVQGPTTVAQTFMAGAHVVDGPPQRVRIDNKGVLYLYGAPPGSRLVLVDGHAVQIQTGGASIDTSITLSSSVPGVVISKGVYTETITGSTNRSKWNYSLKYVGNVSVEASEFPTNSFGVQGFDFSLAGLTTEMGNSNVVVAAGTTIKAHHAFSITGAGTGTIETPTNSTPVVVSGTIATVGKQID